MSLSPLDKMRCGPPLSSSPNIAETRRSHMKVMAVGSIVKPRSPEQRQQIMPHEVPATLKHYLEGKIEQFWFRQDAPGVIFLMNAESVDQAKAELETLPLMAGG